MNFYIVCFLNMFALSSSISAFEHKCLEDSSTLENSYLKNYKICLTIPTNSSFSKLIYYFHGRGGNQNAWLTDKFARDLEAKIIKVSTNIYPIITISMGKETNLAQSNFPHLLTENIFPKMEKIWSLHPDERWAIGKSLGGWNLMQLILENNYFFSKTAFACPAFLPIHPWSPKEEIREFRKLAKPNRFAFEYLLHKSKEFYKELIAFEAVDPFVQIPEKLNKTSGPIFYIEGNEKDNFGFQFGALKIHKYLKANGQNSTWRLSPGRHCKIDTINIAKFLNDSRK